MRKYEVRSTKYEQGAGQGRRPVRRRGKGPASPTAHLVIWLQRSPAALRTSYFALLLAFAFLALLLVYARPLTARIDVGGPGDRAATAGFFDRERTPAGVTYRWTDDSATLIFRAAGLAFPANRPVLLDLPLATSRPASAPAPHVTVAINGTVVEERTLAGEDRLRLTAGTGLGGVVDTRVAITANTFTPSGDRRALGVAILSPARLVEEPGAGLALPPVGAWWRWLATIACACAVALAVLRRPERAAIAGAVVVLALTLAASLARVQFWALIYLVLLGLLALLPIAGRRDLARWSARALAVAEGRWGLHPWGVALVGLVALAIAQGLLTAGRLPALAVALGVLGLVVLLATLVVAPGEREAAPAGNAGSRVSRNELAALAAILALAGVARFYRLGAIPFGIWRDEARHGLEALRIIADPDYRPVYVPNISLPGLYPALLAIDFKLFDASITSLRGLTAGAGVLAIGALWLVARQLWGARVALVAALLGAVGSWRVSIDRLAFDTGPTTLCTLGAFALFLRAVADVRAGRRGLPWFAGAGLAGGLAIYGYYPGRFALPVLAGAAVVLLLAERWGFARRAWPGLALVLIVAALTLVPLGRYAVERPDDFFKRTDQVFLLADQYLEGQTKLAVVEQNLLRHAVMFNWQGEPNARHHAPNWPMLDMVSATCFVVGLALAVIAALHFDFAALFTLGWLLALLAPSIVSVDAPSAVRAQDAAPAAYLLTAVGLVAVWERLRALDAPARLRRAAPAFVGAALVVAVAINLWIYFVRLPGDPRVLGKFQYVGETRAGLAISAEHARAPALVTYLPRAFVGSEVLRFTAGGAPLQELPADAAALSSGPIMIVVPRGEDQDFLQQVAEARRIAAAAGLREVIGDPVPAYCPNPLDRASCDVSSPAGSLVGITFVAFVRDAP